MDVSVCVCVDVSVRVFVCAAIVENLTELRPDSCVDVCVCVCVDVSVCVCMCSDSGKPDRAEAGQLCGCNSAGFHGLVPQAHQGLLFLLLFSFEPFFSSVLKRPTTLVD